jgi:glycosyltransferase involved in cell wall biosynthesis
MKINWFSPLPPLRTGIAQVTLRVIPALSELAKVTLWSDSDRWDRDIERFAEVRRYNPERIDFRELNRADATFYNLGNNVLFHRAIWQVSLLSQGIVILHDIRLHHFFGELFLSQQKNPDAYLSEMEHYYGAEGREDGAALLKAYSSRIDQMAEKYPLTELGIKNALAVLVHSREGFESLKDREMPAAYVPLPFSLDGAPGIETPGSTRSPEKPFRLIMFGFLNPNRRVEQFLSAFANYPNRDSFALDIYGELWDKRFVHNLIGELGIKRHVTLRGFVSEQELDRSLASAHLAVNLRYPSMGEASISQLRCWAHGLPSMVTRVGWYASLPEDSVVFVRPENEAADIHAHLDSFLADPARFAQVGANGFRIVKHSHSPESYANAVIEIAARAKRYRARCAGRELARRTGGVLAAIAPAALSDDRFRTIARNIAFLTSCNAGSASAQG